MKPEDTRPPKGGWAQGKYWCKCVDCKERFIGDKHANQCADCAYGQKPVQWRKRAKCDHCKSVATWEHPFGGLRCERCPIPIK